MGKTIGIVLGLTGFILLIPLCVIALGSAVGIGGGATGGDDCDTGGSDLFVDESGSNLNGPGGLGPGGDKPPAKYIPMYQGAASRVKLGPKGPSVLAGIHYEETKFGDTGSNKNGTEYEGPMAWSHQYFPDYAVVHHGKSVGEQDLFNVTDAIYAAANRLKKAGAPKDWHGAIYAYNHSNDYVSKVLADADKYDIPATGGGGTVGDDGSVGGDCPSGDGDDGGTVSGDVQELAQQILKDKNITIEPNPEGSLKAAADGKCSPVPFTGDCVKLDKRLLQGILETAQRRTFTITSLSTGDHSDCSNHYQGRAVDMVPAEEDLLKDFRKLGATETMVESDPPHTHAGWDGPNPNCE